MGKPDGEEDRELRARLDKLSASLDVQRQGEQTEQARRASEEQQGGDAGRAMTLGFRVLSELIAGVLIGMAIGWQLDRWLSTGPWLMIVFLFLGTAAGIFNVVRAAGQSRGGT